MCILYFVEIFNYYYGNSEMVSYHNSIFNLTVNWQITVCKKQWQVQQKFGTHVSAIRTLSRLEGVSVNAQRWNSTQQASLAWLVEDQYLRRGLRLKSVSTAFQQLAEMPGSRRKTRQLSNFTLTRTFSSGPKLAAFDFGNQHVSIIIHD